MIQNIQYQNPTSGASLPTMALWDILDEGRYPCTTDGYFSFSVAPHSVFPAFDITHETWSQVTTLVKNSNECIVMLRCYNDSTTIFVAGPTHAHMKAEFDRLDALMETLRPAVVDTAPSFRVWTKGSNGASPKTTTVRIPDWEISKKNYPTNTLKQLDQLHSLSAPPNGGRIVLMHGLPGTGKTTAIKALVGKWREWATVEFLSDSGDLQDDSFTSEVLTYGESYSRASMDKRMVKTEKWKVVVAEDCDAWLEGAHRERGTHLGQFLNITDGVSSAGGQAIFILTTNEPISKLHPALTRPGRCLAVVEFEKFTPNEARNWLNDPSETFSGDVTLAELYQKEGAFDYFEQKAPALVGGGTYL